MDKISKAIKCVNCKQLLSKPVILPCGHSICKSHAPMSENQVLCVECGIHHENQDFVVNKALEDVIASQVASLDFGTDHKKASQSCERLNNLLDEFNLLQKDPVFFTHEKISKLRNRVLLSSEQFKLKLEENTQKLLDILQKFEDDCKTYVLSSDYKSKHEEIQRTINSVKSKLDEWMSNLNELKFDETSWKVIQEESCTKCKEIVQDLKGYKQSLLLDQYEQKSREIELFENIDMDAVFGTR